MSIDKHDAAVMIASLTEEDFPQMSCVDLDFLEEITLLLLDNGSLNPLQETRLTDIYEEYVG